MKKLKLKDLAKINVPELMALKGGDNSGEQKCDSFACIYFACIAQPCSGFTCITYACRSSMDL